MVWLKALETSRHVRPIGLRWLSEKESDACGEAFAKGNAIDPCRAHSVKAWRSATCVTAELAHFNNLSGARWPLDMPADVVCALMQHLVRTLGDAPSAARRLR